MSASLPQNLTARIAALPPEKRALLELRLKQKQEGQAGHNTIPRRATHDAPPLSSAQQRLWFLDQLEPHSAGYNMRFAVRLQGPLDITHFHRAVNALVARHEILRTTFISGDDGPRQ